MVVCFTPVKPWSTANPRLQKKDASSSEFTCQVTFNIPKEGRQETIPCDDGTYILDAVEASGVDLGFDCTAGKGIRAGALVAVPNSLRLGPSPCSLSSGSLLCVCS